MAPITPFKTTHPDYLTYSSEHYELKSVTRGIASGLKGLVSRFSTGKSSYRHMADIFRQAVPMEPSTNSNRPWLDGDLDEGISALLGKPLHKFMDAIGEVRDYLSDPAFDTALEELLEENKFGYYIEGDQHAPHWELRDENTGQVTTELQDTIVTLGSMCAQAAEHFEQAKNNLKREDSRSRKDAVRDSLSAVESLYKSLSGQNDIAFAWKALRDSGSWGPTEIVKDGYVVWSQIQIAYPDIRHGQASSTSISHEEAFFWIDRLAVFARYLARKAVDNGTG